MRYRIFLFLFLLSFFIMGCSPFDGQSNTHNILVIHSYEPDFRDYPDFNKLIEKEFRENHIKANIRTEYLNCEMFLSEGEFKWMRDLLDSIKTFSPDIIIVNEDQAAYSLLACGHPDVSKYPIVFAGVSFPNYSLIEKYPNATGFRDTLDIIESFKVCKELSGGNRAMIIVDSTIIDMKVREVYNNQMLRELNSFERSNHLPLTPFAPQTIDSILYSAGKHGLIPDIMKVPVRSGVLRRDGHLWTLSREDVERHYIQTKRDYTVFNIARLIQSKCFTAINEAFGNGESLLGGYFVPLENQVKDEVGLAVKILNGASPSDFPIQDSHKEYQIDWEVMQLYNLKLSDIPLKKYKVVNIDFKDRHPLAFYSLISLFSATILTILIVSLLLYFKEQSKRRTLIKELEKEQKFLMMATKGSQAFVWRWANGQFYFEKPFFELISEPFTDGAFTIKDMVKYIYLHDRIAAIDIIKQYGTQNLIDTHQLRANFSGEYEWWEIRHSSSMSDDGTINVFGIIINIQALKNYEKEFEIARDMAEKAEIKQSFLANMSHEIRTPLNSIVGFSNILASSEVPEEERQECAKIINANNEILIKLISDVLEVSRIESGHMPFNIETLSISSIIDTAFSTNEIIAPSNINFYKESREAEGIYVNVDKMRVSQILNNFISNAFKFTSQGYVKLGVKAYRELSEIELFVEDTGIGIDEAGQKMIFARFFKQDEFAQGTGLGLSICKIIAEKLNGRITVESKLGSGSTFSLILPIIADESNS